MLYQETGHWIFKYTFIFLQINIHVFLLYAATARLSNYWTGLFLNDSGLLIIFYPFFNQSIIGCKCLYCSVKEKLLSKQYSISLVSSWEREKEERLHLEEFLEECLECPPYWRLGTSILAVGDSNLAVGDFPTAILAVEDLPTANMAELLNNKPSEILRLNPLPVQIINPILVNSEIRLSTFLNDIRQFAAKVSLV